MNPSRLPTPQLSRRRVLAAFAGAAGVGLLSCRPSTTGPRPDLTVLVREQPLPAIQNLLDQQVTEAARQQHVNLSVHSVSASTLQAKLSGAAAANQLPDLAIVGDFDFAPLAARGFLLDLRTFLEQITGLNGELFSPLRSLAAAGPFEDRSANDPIPAWAVPLLSRGPGWLVRQDEFAAKGIPLPKSFDDARQAASRLLNATTRTFGWGTALPMDNATESFGRLVLSAYGTVPFDPLGFKIALDPTTAEAGLTALAVLYRDAQGTQLAPPGAIDWTAEEAINAFLSGQVAQMFDPGGLYGQIASRDPSFRETTLVLPPPAGPKGWLTAAASDLAIVSKVGKAPNLAAAVLEAWLRPAAFRDLARAGAGGVVPAYAYVNKDPFWDEDPNYGFLALNARGDPSRAIAYAGTGYPGPPTLVTCDVEAALPFADAVRAVARGDRTPREAATLLVDRCQSLAQRALADAATSSPRSTHSGLDFLRSLISSNGG